MELNSKITQAKAECGLNAPRRDFKGSKTPDLSSRQVKMRNLEPVALRMGRIQKNSRNRRSISDPNIPRSFFEVKKLWDEKVQSGFFWFLSIKFKSIVKNRYFCLTLNNLKVFNCLLLSNKIKLLINLVKTYSEYKHFFRFNLSL